jgi:hypothetical protein
MDKIEILTKIVHVCMKLNRKNMNITLIIQKFYDLD